MQQRVQSREDFFEKSAFLLELKNLCFCLDICFLSLPCMFPALPGAARCALASYYMTRKAVLPKSNTVTEVIGPVHGKNCFHYLGQEKAEMLEICKFNLMPEYFFAVSFDCRCRTVWPNRKMNLQRPRFKPT